jgi:hypothetical protein
LRPGVGCWILPISRTAANSFMTSPLLPQIPRT